MQDGIGSPVRWCHHAARAIAGKSHRWQEPSPCARDACRCHRTRRVVARNVNAAPASCLVPAPAVCVCPPGSPALVTALPVVSGDRACPSTHCWRGVGTMPCVALPPVGMMQAIWAAHASHDAGIMSSPSDPSASALLASRKAGWQAGCRRHVPPRAGDAQAGIALPGSPANTSPTSSPPASFARRKHVGASRSACAMADSPLAWRVAGQPAARQGDASAMTRVLPSLAATRDANAARA